MKTLVHCGELFDSINGAVLKDQDVLISGKTVLWTGPKGEAPEAADQELDLSHCFVMPGLIDSHVHTSMDGYMATSAALRTNKTIGDVTLFSMVNAQKDLMAGFTTIRDEGSMGYADVSLRNAINAGLVAGPRMFVSGMPLSATGGHSDDRLNPYTRTEWGVNQLRVDSPDEGRKAARFNLKYGADQIKIMATGGVMSSGDLPGAAEFSEEEMKAILQVTNSRGRNSSAHAHGADGIKMAVRNGITSIEHGMMMDDECIDMMASHGTYLVPTIIAAKAIIDLGTAGGLSEETVSKAKACLEKHGDNLKKCYAKGVKIIFGTDAGTPGNYHGQQTREFELLHTYSGMTVTEVLQAATALPAKMQKLEGRLGCIKAGSYADLVAYKNSPYDDLSVMNRASFVMKDGVIYKDETR